jgi:hypothetical protein
MAQIIVKNLTIDVTDKTVEQDWEQAVKRAFETVDPSSGIVNLVKVKFTDIPMEKVCHAFKYLSKDLERQGLTNCVFVPLHPQGIQDISIEQLVVANER